MLRFVLALFLVSFLNSFLSSLCTLLRPSFSSCLLVFILSAFLPFLVFSFLGCFLSSSLCCVYLCFLISVFPSSSCVCFLLVSSYLKVPFRPCTLMSYIFSFPFSSFLFLFYPVLSFFLFSSFLEIKMELIKKYSYNIWINVH